MSSLTLPQARSPIAWVMIGGVRTPAEIDIEWMRALIMLVTRTGGTVAPNIDVPSLLEKINAKPVVFSDDPEDSWVIPGPTGPTGIQGPAGFPIWGSDGEDGDMVHVVLSPPGLEVLPIGQVVVKTVGRGLSVPEGSNAKQGTATLVAGAATVSNTSVTASSRIFLTTQSLGTVAAPKAIAVTARTAGTSFVITSSDATDTSVIAYEIFEPS